MRRRSLTILSAYLLTSLLGPSSLFAGSAPAALLKQTGGKILFLGDSLTAGDRSYPEIIQEVLDRSFPGNRIRVAKHGVSGAKMSELRKWAAEDLQGIHCDATVVFVQDAGLTDAPLNRFEEALFGLIEVAGNRPVYLINEGRKPGWEASDKILQLWSVGRTDRMEGLTAEEFYAYWVDQLNPALRRCAERASVDLVDYNEMLARFYRNNPRFEILHPDGVHLGEGGRFLLATLCLKSLGFSRSELDLSGIDFDQALKQAVADAVFGQ